MRSSNSKLPLKNPHDSQLRVLYLDGSMKFGGAVKSLSLMLSALKNVSPIIITCQDKEIIDKWFNKFRVFRFKRFFSYVSRNRLEHWLRMNISSSFTSRLILLSFSLFSKIESMIITIRVICIAKYFKIDLMHLNTGFKTLNGLSAARILKIPCVVHLRGFFLGNRKTIVRTMHQAAKVIGVSNAVSKSVYQYGMVNDKIITVYDSVDMVAFEKAVIERLKTRHEVGLKESDVATGIFGRIVPWKGQLEFTYAALQAIKVNQKIKVVIVGDESDGLEDYFNKIKDVIYRSGYQDHFILTGYKEDVEELFAAMDIVVHASIEPEPFGMVVIEAMAASKPVIATNAGGPSEIINSMVEGILVPPGDIKEMTAAILELVNDSAKRESMGRRGHAKVRTQYTNQIISSKIEKVYQDLMCHTMRETQA